MFGIMNEHTLKLTAAAKEARRKLAIRNVLGGRSQADVADFLGVHPVTVAKWMARHRTAGGAGCCSGWNDQNERSSSVMTTAPGSAGSGRPRR